MSEKLYIKNFAGIREAEFDINKINILIGPQATGKSVVAKLLYFCKSFYDNLYVSIMDQKKFDKFILDLQTKFDSIFPVDFLTGESYKIQLNQDNESIVFEQRSNVEKRSIVLSSFYLDLYKTCNVFYMKTKETEGNDIAAPARTRIKLKEFLLLEVEKKFGRYSYVYAPQLYIPASRAFVNLIKQKSFSLSNNLNMDYFLKEFGSFYEDIIVDSNFNRTINLSINSEKKELLTKNIEKIIEGKSLYEKGEIYIQHTDGRKIRIDFTSTGQQEMVPLIASLLNIVIYHGSENPFIYIEEPEAHIFPSTQKLLVEFLALIDSISLNTMNFFIVSHSPYILTSFNNLIKAGHIRKKIKPDKLEELYKYVPEEQILNPDDVNVYSLEEGKLTNLIDRKTGLIKTNVIDAVSEELSIKFDQLLDVEYK